MKKILLLISLIILAVHAFALPEELSTLPGSYRAVEATCSIEGAEISSDGSRSLVVKTVGSTQSAHHFDVERLNRSVKQTKTVDNFKVRHSFKKGTLLSETKGCVSGWLFCGPWHLDLAVERVDAQTIKISSTTANPCVLKKRESLVISDSDSGLLKQIK